MSLADVFDGGLNCLLLVQMYLEEICGWYGLPKDQDYTGQAFFHNQKLFHSICPEQPLRDGDVFLFGPVNLQDFHKLHLAVFINEYNENGQPLLLHATNYQELLAGQKPGVYLHDLATLKSFPKYQQLYGIRRLK